MHAYVRKQTRIRWIQATLTSIVSPPIISRPVTWKNKYVQPPRHPEKSPVLLWARSGISRRMSLPVLTFPILLPILAVLYLLPSYAVFLSLSSARARACLARVSACTYIRYLRAYIWVPIYRYQMVNERVDARSGRPQLAATQSFVYRGAVCATAHTGWSRSVDIFFPRAPGHETGQPIQVG